MTPAMARAPAPTLSPQMFRHFAVVTVVITGLIAMFADGENREMLTQQAQAAQQTSHHGEKTDLGSGQRTLIRSTSQRDQGWGADEAPPSAPRHSTGRRRGNGRNGSPYDQFGPNPPVVAFAHESAATMNTDPMVAMQRAQQRQAFDPSDLPRQPGRGPAMPPLGE